MTIHSQLYSLLHCIRDPRVICPFYKHFAPFRVDPLIERHAHRIHLRYGRVKMRFKVAVRSERFTDMARPAVFGVQLDGFIVQHILYIG